MDKAAEVVPVVLVRNAQSQWNWENRFIGWADPELTSNGYEQALDCAEKLSFYRFDQVFSSPLQRALKTAEVVLNANRMNDVPHEIDWRLNPRHEGRLQGFNRDTIAIELGRKRIERTSRGYLDWPLPLSQGSPSHPRNDPRYADVDPVLLPGAENLRETRLRVRGFWQEKVVPAIQKGLRQLVICHDSTLRALMMELTNMSVEAVEEFSMPFASPLVCWFDREARPTNWELPDQDQQIDFQSAELVATSG